jgi:hypothetical protein
MHPSFGGGVASEAAAPDGGVGTPGRPTEGQRPGGPEQEPPTTGGDERPPEGAPASEPATVAGGVCPRGGLCTLLVVGRYREEGRGG